jgi:hypothetical protein
MALTTLSMAMPDTANRPPETFENFFAVEAIIAA